MDDNGTFGQIQGSSAESFADAVIQALRNSPADTNHRLFSVAGQEVEEGGVVGGVTYRVTLNPQPLPPGPDDATDGAADLNPQPLPPGPDDAEPPADSLSPGEEVELNPQPLPPAPEEFRPRRRWW